jgi:hypothetical protein
MEENPVILKSCNLVKMEYWNVGMLRNSGDERPAIMQAGPNFGTVKCSIANAA